MSAGDRPEGPPTDARPAAALPDYYTRQYCEENVWHLCQDPGVEADEAHVVFISNAQEACAFWMQRAAPAARQPVLWDYHVILLGRQTGWKVWDLDSRLPRPVDALEYLRETFRHERAVPAPLRPRFRVVPRAIFLDTFASDRSHMRLGDGGWLAPPPPRPPIRTAAEAMNLPRFVDTRRPFVGRLFDLAGLRGWLAAGG
ncbi:MAG TPA: protein N-terminal glutamine amidohydrolase [Polyangiaceae bacterium]|nr:protein N-terminal glutamine amidohydrolase [Polyangiaceae bacterium]